MTDTASQSMTSLERRATFGLAGIFMLRMLGLFLILPVFALYAEHLPRATPFMIGLALGAYGLTQAVLQIPFGMASDRFGRKPVIVIGLLVFIAGSVIAANATSLEMIVVGRALQGAGAIAAAVLAMVADLTRERQRTKAMALIGISIGASFILSLLLGPVLNTWIGVPGIFWLTAVLAGFGIVVLLTLVPTPVRARHRQSKQSLTSQFKTVLTRPELLRLDFGIFVLHCVLTAVFVVIPLSLAHQAGFPVERHWQVYLPVMLLGIAIMVPFLLLSDRQNALRPVFIGAVAVLTLSQAIFYVGSGDFWWLAAGLVVFFAAFNLLEATLPSLISKTAPVNSKGTAIGVYNSFEFFGAFVGGAFGGYLYGAYGAHGVYLFSFVLISAWILVAWGVSEPVHQDTHTLRFSSGSPEETEALAARLEAVEGVSEVVLVAEEGLAYIKANAGLLNRAELEAILGPEQAVQ